MYKETVTYTDFNGMERTEDFYFNLTKAELLDMNLATGGGFLEMIRTIINAKDTPELIKLFKNIILAAYGVKSEDGRKFKKSDEIKDDFMSTQAFSEIYMKLATDSDAASKFINGIIPADLAKQANDMVANGEIDEDTKKLLDTLKTE